MSSLNAYTIQISEKAAEGTEREHKIGQLVVELEFQDLFML
jgi:hypothetical protein